MDKPPPPATVIGLKRYYETLKSETDDKQRTLLKQRVPINPDTGLGDNRFNIDNIFRDIHDIRLILIVWQRESTFGL